MTVRELRELLEQVDNQDATVCLWEASYNDPEDDVFEINLSIDSTKAYIINGPRR